jgi:hypothetical protein
VSSIAILFGAYEQDGLHAIFSVPKGAFEAALAIYLIVKGARPSADSRRRAQAQNLLTVGAARVPVWPLRWGLRCNSSSLPASPDRQRVRPLLDPRPGTTTCVLYMSQLSRMLLTPTQNPGPSRNSPVVDRDQGLPRDVERGSGRADGRGQFAASALG